MLIPASTGLLQSASYLAPNSTVLDSFGVAGDATSVTGLAYDGANLISCCDFREKIYVHSGVSSTELSSFSSPANNPLGLAYDGSNLLSVSAVTDLIYTHSGVSSSISSSFSTVDGNNVYGIALDNDGNLISLDSQDDFIYVHSGVSSTITETIDISSIISAIGQDIAFDGTNLILIDGTSPSTFKILDGISNTVLSTFNTGVNGIEGATMIEGHLYSVSTTTDLIYKHGKG